MSRSITIFQSGFGVEVVLREGSAVHSILSELLLFSGISGHKGSMKNSSSVVETVGGSDEVVVVIVVVVGVVGMP